MKLKDITNSKCDVRKFMKVCMREEDKTELANHYDVDYGVIENIIESCSITVSYENLETEIVPVDIQKMLEEQSNEL
ncbi:hypothetical protein [Vagococcus fluvialis]|uniref:hypothetical protein n=1 Tax=Vagococcus fluvialis TaxID=2738 RepID=UPI001D0B0C9F|nr:hypothetical protein [Vagococcus fluvialis]UDM74974.1 hypothetical protein K5K99_05205 [Vagococcus fluvialis]